MSSLRELQHDCYRAFLLDDTAPVLSRLVDNHIPAAARVQVYQNNARENFRKTLASSYPVIERLVGDACFRTLARSYMREYPSRSGDLQNFGRKFPEFLGRQYGSSEFDYLPDVASLEWAIEEVMLVAEGGTLDVQALAPIDPEQLEDIVFELSPMCLVRSRYPILDIWRANQCGQERDVDLAQGPQHVTARRRAGHAEMQLLDPAAFELAVALQRGTSLGEISDALGDPPAFDLTRALRELLGHGCLSGFSLGRKED